MFRATTGSFLALLLAGTTAWGATIVVGHHEILPQPNQKIPIYIVYDPGIPGDPENPADDPVAGISFNVQIADGGPETPDGVIVGPLIEYVQLVDDPVGDADRGTRHYFTDEFGPTIFDSELNGGNYGAHGLVRQVFTELTYLISGNLVADGLLAIITIDGSGFQPGDGPNPDGSWDLLIGNTLNGRTVLDVDSPMPIPLPLVVTEGTVSIVPEPSTLAMLVLGALGLLLWRRRR